MSPAPRTSTSACDLPTIVLPTAETRSLLRDRRRSTRLRSRSWLSVFQLPLRAFVFGPPLGQRLLTGGGLNQSASAPDGGELKHSGTSGILHRGNEQAARRSMPHPDGRNQSSTLLRFHAQGGSNSFAIVSACPARCSCVQSRTVRRSRTFSPKRTSLVAGTIRLLGSDRIGLPAPFSLCHRQDETTCAGGSGAGRRKRRPYKFHSDRSGFAFCFRIRRCLPEVYRR